MSASPHLLRLAADLLATQRRLAQTLARLAYAVGVKDPALRPALRPVAHLLAEIEGRYCDLSDHLHQLAREAETATH